MGVFVWGLRFCSWVFFVLVGDCCFSVRFTWFFVEGVLVGVGVGGSVFGFFVSSFFGCFFYFFRSCIDLCRLCYMCEYFCSA